MAKVRKNIVIKGLSGSLGNQLVIRSVKGGRTVVSLSPTFPEDRQFTDAQKQHQEDFREAAAFAKTAQKDAVYMEKAEVRDSHSFNVAMADWFHAPEILDIDLADWNGDAGKKLRIKAFDDVKVKQVTLAITDEAGALLEQGAATQADGLWWEYVTKSAASGHPKVLVSVEDLPGHIAKMVKSK